MFLYELIPENQLDFFLNSIYNKNDKRDDGEERKYEKYNNSRF